MGVTIRLVQVSTQTLELLQNDISLVDVFLKVRWLESLAAIEEKAASIFEPAHLLKYDWRVLGERFLQDWKLPELDLHKYSTELTFFLTGCAPEDYEDQIWDQPEAKALEEVGLPFLVIPNSKWDGLPLVNAIWGGTGLRILMDGGQHLSYFLPDEAGEVLDGLIELGEAGFQERYRRESRRSQPCGWIDWAEEEMLQWLTDYYNAMVFHFQEATWNKKVVLVILSA